MGDHIVGLTGTERGEHIDGVDLIGFRLFGNAKIVVMVPLV